MDGLGHRPVEVVDELQHLPFEVFRGGETRPPQQLPRQDAEPDLHLVQPRTGSWRVDEAHACCWLTILEAGANMSAAPAADPRWVVFDYEVMMFRSMCALPAPRG